MVPNAGTLAPERPQVNDMEAAFKTLDGGRAI